MVGKNFDDLFKVIAHRSVLPQSTIVSTEIDLELPRGYVVRVKKVMFRLTELADMRDVGAQGAIIIEGALMRDPDDTTSMTIPGDRVQHDAICDYFNETWVNLQTAVGFQHLFLPPDLIYDFGDNLGFDIISARNMRFNARAIGLNDFAGAFNVPPVLGMTMWYTLEKIKDTEIMELLDIL